MVQGQNSERKVEKRGRYRWNVPGSPFKSLDLTKGHGDMVKVMVTWSSSTSYGQGQGHLTKDTLNEIHINDETKLVSKKMR